MVHLAFLGHTNLALFTGAGSKAQVVVSVALGPGTLFHVVPFLKNIKLLLLS